MAISRVFHSTSDLRVLLLFLKMARKFYAGRALRATPPEVPGKKGPAWFGAPRAL